MKIAISLFHKLIILAITLLLIRVVGLIIHMLLTKYIIRHARNVYRFSYFDDIDKQYSSRFEFQKGFTATFYFRQK